MSLSMGDLHLVLPTLNLPILDAAIFGSDRSPKSHDATCLSICDFIDLRVLGVSYMVAEGTRDSLSFSEFYILR